VTKPNLGVLNLITLAVVYAILNPHVENGRFDLVASMAANRGRGPRQRSPPKFGSKVVGSKSKHFGLTLMLAILGNLSPKIF